MQHDACRAIASAVKVLQSEPLSQRGRELLSTIARSANEAADEIEYLQTAASVYRPDETLPQAYDDCRLSNKEREFLTILYRAKGCVVTRPNIMAQLYSRQDVKGGKNSEEVGPKILEAFLFLIRRKLKPFRKHLEDQGLPSIVETLFGTGYRLVHLNQYNAIHEGKYKTNK